MKVQELMFGVDFHFIGVKEEKISEKDKNDIINQFLALREVFCTLVNPMYESWNNEYTDPVSGPDDEKYNNYIVEKHRPIIEEINRAAKKSDMFVRLGTLPKEPTEVCGVFFIKKNETADKEKCMVYFTLKPM